LRNLEKLKILKLKMVDNKQQGNINSGHYRKFFETLHCKGSDILAFKLERGAHPDI